MAVTVFLPCARLRDPNFTPGAPHPPTHAAAIAATIASIPTRTAVMVPSSNRANPLRIGREVDAVAMALRERFIVLRVLARHDDLVLVRLDDDLIVAPELTLEHLLVHIVIEDIDVAGFLG